MLDEAGKRRKKLRKEIITISMELARQRESSTEEGRMMLDHVHMLMSIPPRYSVAQAVGNMKGKNAIHVARNFLERQKNFTGQHFWATGAIFVSRDEKAMREYIKKQETEDKRLDQLHMFK